MQLINWNTLSEQQQTSVLQRPQQAQRTQRIRQTQKIIDDVKQRGDEAIRDYTETFDKITLSDFRISAETLQSCENKVSLQAQSALQIAATHIRRFHQPQVPQNMSVTIMPEMVCQRIYRPITRVGLYVPGGNACLPSSVLMQAIPAMIAQCPQIILCSPPQADGQINPHILFAAKLCGIKQVFAIGGAQAIAAMAYGTASVPKVDKVFGPGNQWVTQAKCLVANDPAGATCDLPAGPSEVLIIADETANPAFIAADLLAQAEHDSNAQVLLLCTTEKTAREVMQAIKQQMQTLTRIPVITASLTHSKIILVRDLEQAIGISNQYAPEHLILNCAEAPQMIERISDAGSVFIGPWTPESVGDYASGTNHVLPTDGYARSCSGLSVLDFMKAISVQQLSQKALTAIADTVTTLATIEGLSAHKQAVTIRLQRGAT